MGITDHCQFDDSQMPRLLTILNSLWSFASPRLCVRGTPPTIISSCRDFLSVRRLAGPHRLGRRSHKSSCGPMAVLNRYTLKVSFAHFRVLSPLCQSQILLGRRSVSALSGRTKAQAGWVRETTGNALRVERPESSGRGAQRRAVTFHLGRFRAGSNAPSSSSAA